MSSGEVHLSIGKAYSAAEAAELLGMDVRTFNRRVDEGMIAHYGRRGKGGSADT